MLSLRELPIRCHALAGNPLRYKKTYISNLVSMTLIHGTFLSSISAFSTGKSSKSIALTNVTWVRFRSRLRLLASVWITNFTVPYWNLRSKLKVQRRKGKCGGEHSPSFGSHAWQLQNYYYTPVKKVRRIPSIFDRRYRLNDHEARYGEFQIDSFLGFWIWGDLIMRGGMGGGNNSPSQWRLGLSNINQTLTLKKRSGFRKCFSFAL